MSDAAAFQSSQVDDENLMLHRVGEAVALMWRYLPDTVKAIILNQAETLAYRGERVEARGILESALERYATRAS